MVDARSVCPIQATVCYKLSKNSERAKRGILVMNGTNSSQFHHRLKADGMIDSICLRCYLTAGSAENEADLRELEAAHQCPDREPSILTEILPRSDGSG
jgi:hypothetical protein